MTKLFAVLAIFSFSFAGCLFDTSVNPVEKTVLSINTAGSALADAPPAYQVTLEPGYPAANGDGTYTWLWKIVNTNPGNGQNGTTQNLSHWDMTLGSCLLPEHLVSAAYGTDLNNLTSFIPVVELDPSNTCTEGVTGLVKFNFGTNGSTPSYYKLVINQNFYPTNEALLYFKSGKYTGCGTMNFQGIGCENPTLECTDETGFGGESAGGGNAWWFYYNAQTGGVQNIYAGQTMIAGTVELVGSNLVITLGSEWSLQDVPEPVKVQGYAVIPSTRPSSGLFTLYKGTSLTVPVDGSNYYVVHLDLKHCL